LTPDDSGLRDLESAFASMADDGRSTDPCPDAATIWDAVRGTSPAAERRTIIDHLASCGPCSEAWRIALAAGAAERRPAETRRGTARSWLAAAAVLIGATALWTVTRPTGTTEYRQGPRQEIVSLVPAGASLPRSDFRLRWSPLGSGAIYRLRVATEGLDVLASIPNLSATEHVVPAEALAVVDKGATIVWQVEAVLPDGRHVSSASFTARIE